MAAEHTTDGLPYFWLGREAESIPTPWRTAWLGFARNQQPLGEPFSTILHENLGELYVRSE